MEKLEKYRKKINALYVVMYVTEHGNVFRNLSNFTSKKEAVKEARKHREEGDVYAAVVRLSHTVKEL